MDNLKKKNEWLWDKLATYFDTHITEEDIEPDAAVNIHIGWPVFFSQIETQSQFLGKKHLSVLDFGCGVGSLCKAFHTQGHNVTGMDYSKEMLQKASLALPKDISLLYGNHKSELFQNELKNTFDVVTAMHVFDWIRDMPTAITNLTTTLKRDGILIFSVFPEKHIINSLEIEDLFENFDSNANPKRGYANFEGVSIPVYIKGSRYYDRIFKKMGYEKLLEYYPPYPKSFLDKYEWTGSLYPEMLILAYRKTTS